MNTMHTIKLYQQDVDRRECDSTLLSVICDPEQMKALGAAKKENTFLAVLDQTVFFPEGGGQPCDLGFIENYPVFYVFEKDKIIYHQLSAPTTNIPAFLAGEGLSGPGAAERTVHCELDWNRRFLHMQLHCGEHILSGMFFQEFGGVNRGFHMGDDYVTIDINLEANPAYTAFTQDMIDRVEMLANKAVWENVPVITRHFDTRAEAAGLPLRKPLAIEEDITIVCVGDPEHAADCVACCGTHPKTAGQVGLIKITKAEAYKGMTRFYAKAGLPALNDYILKHKVVAQLCSNYSADPETLTEKIRIQESKNGAVRKELYDLKKSLIARYAKELTGYYENLPGAAQGRTAAEQKIKPAASEQKAELSTPITIKRYDDLNVDDLQTLGRHVTPAVRGLLALVALKENTVLLVSQGTPDCGKLVKENASIYQGKGGGNATLARAIFPKSENVDWYLDLLEKHLR